MSYNPKNFGIAIGTVLPVQAGAESCVKEFGAHADGSQRIALTVSVSDNFRSRYSDAEVSSMPENVRAARRIARDKDGVLRGFRSQSIGFEMYVPASEKGVALRNRFRALNPGDLVEISYSVKASSYTDREGRLQFKQWLEIEELSLLRRAASKSCD